ncbi:MAG: FHA domain-containing protein, partial [Planctomycetota bacterium]
MQSIKVVAVGESWTVSIPPAPNALVVGSGPAADVVLMDPEVDPRHLVLESTPEGVRLSDVGSRLGTRLNGLLVNQALLRVGDEIRVGSTTLTLIETAEVSPPRPAEPKPAPERPRTSYSRRRGGRAEAKPKAKRAAGEKPESKVPVATTGQAPQATAPRPGARPEVAKTRGLGFWLLIGLAVAVLGAGVVFWSSQAGRRDAAEIAYRKAFAMWDEGDSDAAEKAFQAVLIKWPDTNAASKSKEAMAALEAERRREAEAVLVRKELGERWTQLTLEELEKEFQEFRSEFEGTAAASEDGFLEKIRELYREEAARRLSETRKQAAERLDAGRFYDAVLVWHEYIYLPSNIPPDIPGATEEMKEIQVRATEAYEALTTEAGSLAEEERLDEAIALLAENVGRFRGTRHSFSLREKIEVFELEKKGETEAPEEVKEKVVRRHEFLRAAEDAEALAQRRKYGDAAVAYRQAATDCPFEDLVAEFTARADELAAFGSLFTELRSQIASHPARFRNITLGHGFKANAVGADDEHLAVAVRGAESRLSWSRMGTGRILALFLRLRLAPEGHLWLARYAFEAGDLDRAHAAVSTALEGDESLRETAFLILSRAKGVPVPEGGFVTYKKRWLTPAERSAAELADQIEDSERAAKSSDARRRDAALAELRELGETAKPALTRALDHQLLAAVEALETLPILKSPGTRQMLSGELETRRKAALALIFDTEKYPYPHPEGPAYDAVQAEVIQLVDKVREVWDRPIALILQKHPEALDIYSRAEGYSIELTSLGS